MDDYRKGLLIVGFGALLFAPDSLMLRLMAMEQWPTVFWRGLLSGVIFTTAFLVIRRTRLIADIRALGPAAIIFTIFFSSTTICFVYAVRETSVANTLFLVSTSPLFSALLSWAFLGEQPDRRTWRTILLAMIGIAIIAFGHAGDAELKPNRRLGDLAAIGAAISLAISFVVARRVRPRAMTPLIGPAGLLSAAIAFMLAGDLAIPQGSLWPLLVMAVIIMPVATFCLTIGPRYIPAPEVSLLLLVEAVTAPLLIWAALGERPGQATLIGGAIILSAIAWSAAERMRPS